MDIHDSNDDMYRMTQGFRKFFLKTILKWFAYYINKIFYYN
jgi:hypothetical protein